MREEESLRLKKLALKEELLREKGYQNIAGVDEVGRGTIAGPVVAAACILSKGILIEEIDDSKKLTALARKRVFDKLKSHPEVEFAIGVVEAELIDQINILRASLEAMVIAVSALRTQPDFILIDGNQTPKFREKIPSEAVVNGDSLILSIAAASIIAKHLRDAMMLEYHKRWPHYQFCAHKGYATEEHLALLRKHGPCPIHRMSFAPVRAL